MGYGDLAGRSSDGRWTVVGRSSDGPTADPFFPERGVWGAAAPSGGVWGGSAPPAFVGGLGGLAPLSFLWGLGGLCPPSKNLF